MLLSLPDRLCESRASVRVLLPSCLCEQQTPRSPQAAELGLKTLRDAATRVFSNSSGSYSSNVNLAVENSSWSDESQLQEMYMKRKSFAFNSDRPGAGGEMQRDVFESAMKTVDVTFQVRVKGWV